MVMASRDHFTSIHFCRIILERTVQNEKLMIPNKFTRIYGRGFPNPVFLQPPDGTEWEVHWIKQDDQIWFQKGWKEFAKYYSLGHGHILMFTYEGTSNLGIVIVDESCLEIDYALHSPHDNVSVDSVNVLDEIPPQQKARPKPALSSLQAHKKMRTEESSSPQNLNLPYHSQEDMGVSTFTADFIRKVESLTANTMTEALKRASTFRSENPFCIIVMQPSYVSKRFSLHMPTEFTDKYLLGKRGVVLLRVLEGRAWSAKYSARKICGGWKKFAVDNKLKVGDVCVFELMQAIDLSFKVLIFRDAEDASCSLWQEKIEPERVPLGNLACSYRMKGVKELSGQKDEYIEDKWGRGIFTSNKRLKFEVVRLTQTQNRPKNTALEKAIKTQIVCEAQEDGANCKDPKRIPDSETNIVCTSKGKPETTLLCDESNSVHHSSLLVTDGKATQRTSFNWPGTNRALEEAKRFSSKNPFFIVNIRPSYLVDTSPSVSRDFLRRYYKNKKQKVMIQYGKRSWMVKLLYNPDSTLGKFSAGWSLFAKENELQVGDVCVFELINAEEFVLGVHIFRRQV